MGDVITLKGLRTTQQIPVEQVLDGAKDALDTCVVIGWEKDAGLYIASSDGNCAEILLLLEMAKKVILEQEG